MSFQQPPTAWQSLPQPIRFAVWVWAVGVIATVVGGAVFAAFFTLGLALAANS